MYPELATAHSAVHEYLSPERGRVRRDAITATSRSRFGFCGSVPPTPPSSLAMASRTGTAQTPAARSRPVGALSHTFPSLRHPQPCLATTRAFRNLGNGVGCPWSGTDPRALEAPYGTGHCRRSIAASSAILSLSPNSGTASGRAHAGKALALVGAVPRGRASRPAALTAAAESGCGWGTTRLSRRVPAAARAVAHALAPVVSGTARLVGRVARLGLGVWIANRTRRAATGAQ
jgi:hypothetical protein